MPLILRPDIRLRKEKYGVLAFSISPANPMPLYTLKPSTAMVLALFDGSRDTEQVATIISKVFEVSTQDATQFVQTVCNSYRSLLTEYEEKAEQKGLYKRYDPREFLYKTEEVTLRRPHAPLTLAYIVTRRCLRQCLYCYADAVYYKKVNYQEDLIPLARLRKLLSEAKTLGIAAINFSGGEPFLRPDIIDILGYTIENGIFPWISTKAHLDESSVRQLREIGLTIMQVSIDSVKPHIADLLTASKGFFKGIVRTIELLIKYGIDVQTNSVITSYNVNDIPQLVEFLISLGVKEIFLTPYTRSLGRHREKLFASTEELQGLQDRLKAYNSTVRIHYGAGNLLTNLENSRAEVFANRLICTGGRLGFVILWDGRVTICERLATCPEAIIGDLNQHTILDLWHSPQMLALSYPCRDKYSGTICYECPEFEICTNERGRCFVRAHLIYGTIFGPDPSCPRVPKSPTRIV